MRRPLKIEVVRSATLDVDDIARTLAELALESKLLTEPDAGQPATEHDGARPSRHDAARRR